MPSVVHLLLVTLFPVAVIVAALRDVATYTIPNWLSAALALAFLPTAFALGLAPGTIGLCIALGAGALAAGVALFALGAIGGGDAKLFAAAAIWLGWSAALPFLSWTALAGGALAVGLLVLRRWPVLAGVSGPAWVGRLLAPKGDVPYGVAIAVGALIAFPYSPLFQALGL